jgi:hypothetical protein
MLQSPSWDARDSHSQTRTTKANEERDPVAYINFRAAAD